jgi:hypothetical protein
MELRFSASLTLFGALLLGNPSLTTGGLTSSRRRNRSEYAQLTGGDASYIPPALSFFVSRQMLISFAPTHSTFDPWLRNVTRCHTVPSSSARITEIPFDEGRGRRYASLHCQSNERKMTRKKPPGEAEYQSPKALREWLAQEVRDVARASELRLRDATDLVTAYALGKLTPEQADERWWRYQDRWGEALPGVFASETKTDEQIIETIDKSLENTNGPYMSARSVRETYERRFGNKTTDRRPRSR